MLAGVATGVAEGAGEWGWGWLSGLLAQAGAATIAGVAVLVPSTTATQDDDGGQVFYHGTSSFSGGPLDAGAAAANNRYGPKSPPGFYLATDPATAVHFAATAGKTPAVLGPVPGSLTQGRALPGNELYVPVTAFPTFNSYLLSGRIILMQVHLP